ncbi:hypothetical protein J132_00608 [Termitomyces sp. J132]|nr:hypothetical protein J132_00608 [Termitomyces sp. J132]
MGREVFVERGGLGSQVEVYDAELTGIARAAMRYVRGRNEIRHIHIFADNTAAITSAYEPKPKPGQSNMVKITHIIDRYLEEGIDRMFGVEWCLGHKEVIGNEWADKEAKEGKELWMPNYTTLTNAKRRTTKSIGVLGQGVEKSAVDRRICNRQQLTTKMETKGTHPAHTKGNIRKINTVQNKACFYR